MFNIGKVIIDDTLYSGIDLYSDGSIEDEMLQIAQNYGKEDYNRIIIEKRSWPILYHFSNVRENIVTWLPITKKDKVLEIGAGCGAITGALSHMAEKVDAVELSMKRSMINAYRHKESDNICIKVGNFQDIEKNIENNYDIITLIGVFEYAQNYIVAKNPYMEFLKNIRQHLAKNGKLIIAIENKFGLKYWAGCREDHTGGFFDGIEGYGKDINVRTFGKKELETLLKNASFKHVEFYYPYPDYKLTEKVFSDECLPKSQDLNSNYRNFDMDRLELFDEQKVYDGLIQEGLFPEFSNSFLVIAQREEMEQPYIPNRYLDDNCFVDMIDLNHLYRDFGKEKTDFSKLIGYVAGQEKLYSAQIFYDYGNGFNENDSKKIIVKPDIHQKCSIMAEYLCNVKNIRIDPAETKCILEVIGAFGYGSNGKYDLSITTNGCAIGKNRFVIDNMDPQIFFPDLQEKTDMVQLEYKILGI